MFFVMMASSAVFDGVQRVRGAPTFAELHGSYHRVWRVTHVFLDRIKTCCVYYHLARLVRWFIGGTRVLGLPDRGPESECGSHRLSSRKIEQQTNARNVVQHESRALPIPRHAWGRRALQPARWETPPRTTGKCFERNQGHSGQQ